MPNDPVGRFHIGNGASLERVNLSADLSEKGLLQSYGVMANYLYDLDVVEENHEIFYKNKVVPVSSEIKSKKKKL
jgi:malonyl-CoA decarboxylase